MYQRPFNPKDPYRQYREDGEKRIRNAAKVYKNGLIVISVIVVLAYAFTH